MASLGVNSVGQSSATLYVSELNTTTTYRSIYISCNGRTSPNLAKSFTSSTSNGWSVPGLSCGNYYSASFNITSSGGSTASGSGGFSTSSCPVSYPVGYVSSVSAEPSSSTNGRVYISWSSATNATHYGVEVKYNGNIVTYDSNVYGTSANFGGLPVGRYYSVKVYGKRQGESNGSPNEYTSFYMADVEAKPVGYVNSVSASASSSEGGKVTVAWSSATNATHYGVELRYNGSVVSVDSNVYGTQAVFYGVPQYRTYSVKVYGKRAGESNGSPNEYTTVFVPDLTPPTVSISSSNGLGRIYVSYYGFDGQSGLRSQSTYLLTIGSAGGGTGTLGASEYTTLTQKSFDSDVNGRAFVHNEYYYVGVRSYDNAANGSTLATVRVQFKSARPASHAWHTTKTKGQPATLTALEWNSFATKINQFRTYKDLTLYSFSNAVKGAKVTASIVNQARTAIAQMVPPSSVPSPASSGGEMTASFLNGLMNSLNSIN